MLSTLHLPHFELGCSIRDLDFDFDFEAMMDPSSHSFPSHTVATKDKMSNSTEDTSSADDHNVEGLGTAKAACHRDTTAKRAVDSVERGYIASQRLQARPRGTNHDSLPTASSSEACVPDKATSDSAALGPPKKKRRIRRRGSGTTLSKDAQDQMLEELGPYDVICGRSSMAYNNTGNRRFRVTINMNLERYIAAPSRHAKSQVIREVSDMLVTKVGVRFLKVNENPIPKSSPAKAKGKGKSGSKQKQKPYELIELHGKDIHNKVSHALRDLVMSQTRSQQAMMTVAMPPGGAIPDHATSSAIGNLDDQPEASLVSSSRPSSASMEDGGTQQDSSVRHTFDEGEGTDQSFYGWPDEDKELTI